MQRSEQINELAAALSKAQGQVKGAIKDADNPYFKSKYADLASTWEACRAALTGNGLSIVQAARSLEAGVEVETMLMHASGQWISETLALPVSKADAQGFGSALTYCRRYGLAAMVGVAPEDDDGNAAAAAKPVQGDFKPQRSVQHKPTDGAMSALSVAQQAVVNNLAGRIVDAFLAKDPDMAYAGYLDAKAELAEDADAKVALWSMLDSKMRSTLKQMENIEALKAATNKVGVQA